MKYRIDLEQDQLLIIAKSLELTSRMYCGQLNTRTLFPLLHELRDKSRIDDIDKLLQDIKNIVWGNNLEHGGHYGIGHDQESDHMYEMYKEILHTLEMIKKEEKGDEYQTNVHSGVPLNITNNPLINVIPLTKDIIREENIEKLLNSD